MTEQLQPRPHSHRTVALLAMALVSLFSLGAGAGSTDPSAFKGWSVSALEIRGADPDLVSGLRRGLALVPRRRFLKRRRPTFYPKILQEDLARARLYLARHGYPRARVAAGFEPEPEKKRVKLLLNVQSGPRVVIDRIVTTGVPVELQKAVSTSLGLEEGSPFSDERVLHAARSAELTLQRASYASVKVGFQISPVDSTRVLLRFEVEPGLESFFGDIQVEGIRQDLLPLARKTIDIRPGEPFSPDRLHSAEENLRLLDLFRRISLTAVPSASDRLDVHAELVEREMVFAEAGIGYWTDDYLRGYSRWGHRNLFKRGRGVEVRGAASRFKQSIGGSTWWPALLGSRTRVILNASLNSEREDGYNLLDLQGGMAVRYRLSPMSAARLGAAVSRIDVEAKIPGEDPSVEDAGLLTILSFAWNREAADNRIYPTRGTVSGLLIEWAPPGAVSDNHFVLGQASVSSYTSLMDDVVLATKVGVGLGRPTGESTVLLPNKRLYAGGSTSMRGFRRRQLGPVDDRGTPIGGEAKLEAAAEIRFPLVWRIKGALFVDSGQVWGRWQGISLVDLEFAVGPGIMVQTPVGPIRLDVGTRLTSKVPMQPKTVLHISIGHPF